MTASRAVGRTRSIRYSLLVGATGAELLLLQLPRHAFGSVAAVVVSAALVGWLVVLELRDRRLGLAAVALAIGLVTTAAVATPPRTSNDLWSYTMYGRMVSEYDTSPYEHVPAEFHHDPFVDRVSGRWLHRAAVYGPLFLGIASIAAWLAGPSALVPRLCFQLVAAFAFALTLLVVWRTTRHLAALIFLGLNPVIAVAVNGGHSDMLIGLALLVAVLFARRRKPFAAGVLIGVAALVKVSGGLALIGVVIWAWRNRERRFAVVASATCGAVIAVAYVPFFASASHVLGGADKTITNGSPWNWIVDRLLRHDAWRNVPDPLAPNGTLTAFFYVGTVAVVAMAVAGVWWSGRRSRPDAAVGAAVAAYPIAAEYAYPWYATWALPLFASDGISALGGVVWLQSVVMLAALKLPLAVRGPSGGEALRILLTDVAPPILLVAFVVAAYRQSRPRSARPRNRQRPRQAAASSAGPSD